MTAVAIAFATAALVVSIMNLLVCGALHNQVRALADEVRSLREDGLRVVAEFAEQEIEQPAFYRPSSKRETPRGH